MLYIVIFLYSHCYGQEKDASSYFHIIQTSDTAKLFKMKGASYLDYFNNEKVEFNHKIYSQRIRVYSWGNKDTSYYREDKSNFYHYNPKTGNENIVLPKKVYVGQNWEEADKSWSYKIIATNKTFVTPEKTYEDAIVVECKQLINRDENKSTLYNMYYVKGIGLVGSESNGELSSFFSEYKFGNE